MPVDTKPDPPYSPSRPGEMPEWLKGADCKSAGVRLRWFESNSLHQVTFSRKSDPDATDAANRGSCSPGLIVTFVPL
ncbi:hypothetical protein AA102526_2008 [Asaia lannensis NBRC 102526]|nr:hypothetical protein AA102526_2008 [Asaia lannensis NBRC 102526]